MIVSVPGSGSGSGSGLVWFHVGEGKRDRWAGILVMVQSLIGSRWMAVAVAGVVVGVVVVAAVGHSGAGWMVQLPLDERTLRPRLRLWGGTHSYSHDRSMLISEANDLTFSWDERGVITICRSSRVLDSYWY